MTTYNSYYKTEDLFGSPYPELINFFSEYPIKGQVLDIGCGQGRDTLALARLGYTMTGIDNSEVGIEQMIEKATAEKLAVTGIVTDLFEWQQFEKYDIVLLDSMFHFEKRDKEKEINLITTIVNSIEKEAIICVCIQDIGDKVNTLKQAIAATSIDFEVLNDSSLIYTYEDKETEHQSKTKYCMYIVKKHL